jgi:hypothetical protein
LTLNRQQAISHTSPISVVPYVIAKARDSRQHPFAFQYAQRLATGKPYVSVLLAETGERGGSPTGLQRPVSYLLTQDRGQAHVSPWIHQSHVS